MVNTETTTVTLGQLATIRPGVHFRKRIEHDPNSDVGVVQMKDIDENNMILADDIYRIDGKGIKQSAYLKRGDVLLRSRGTRFTAAVFDLELSNVIAAYQFLVLTLDTKRIRPDYLVWYVNQEPSQKYFTLNATGSHIQMIHRNVLADLQVITPSLEQQELIVNIDRLVQRETAILEEIKAKRIQLIQEILNHSIEQ